jgi:hypothetical protein
MSDKAKPWKLRNQIPEMLSSRPMSSNDIAELTGRNRNAVRIVLVAMHKAGEIHIAGWNRSPRGPAIALFAPGKGTDAEKPEPLNNSEICKRYRSTEKGRAIHLKSSRKWYRLNNGAAMRNIQRKNEKLRRAFETGGLKAIDPLLAAIMG